MVRQIGYQAPQPAQRFTPQDFKQWLQKQVTQGEPVAVCYEAGCFGYEPARRFERMGAQVYVIAPEDWDERKKRQVNDKFDARVMCRRLSDYLCGERHALSIVRVPSPEEEARRAKARQRDQLRILRNTMALERRIARQRGLELALEREREPHTHGFQSGYTFFLTRIPKLIGAIWRNLLAASAIRRASPYLSDTLRPSSCHRDSASCTISSPPTSEFGFNRPSAHSQILWPLQESPKGTVDNSQGLQPLGSRATRLSPAGTAEATDFFKLL